MKRIIMGYSMLNPVKFYRLEFIVRNLGISTIAIAVVLSLGFDPSILEIVISISVPFLIQLHSWPMNNYFDYLVWGEENYIGELIEGGWKKPVILSLCFMPFVFLGPIIWIYPEFSWIPLLYIVIFTLYQAPGFRLKDDYILSIIMNSLGLGWVLFAYPYLFLTHSIDLIFITLSIIFFFYMAFHEVVHQIAHQDKDDIYSLVDAVGISGSVFIANVFLVIPIIFATVTLLVDPVRYLFITGVLIFSTYRIYRLSGMDYNKKNFQKIRNRWDKFYSFQEAAYIIIILVIIYFI